MCMFKPPKMPKIPATPPPAQMQPMQMPKEMAQGEQSNRNRLRRRGMWASIFTGPAGITGAPRVTGNSGGMTGG